MNSEEGRHPSIAGIDQTSACRHQTASHQAYLFCESPFLSWTGGYSRIMHLHLLIFLQPVKDVFSKPWSDACSAVTL